MIVPLRSGDTNGRSVRLASELAGYLPPRMRRAFAGAWLDLKGVRSRLLNRERWGEPLQMMHNVGGGDYEKTGAILLAQLSEHAGLTASSHVLDVGCGTGRLAQPLSQFLTSEGGYVGFDISTVAISFCRKRIGTHHPGFVFVASDIHNLEYNPNGSIPENAYEFPVGDDSIDVAAAFSVFSHMGEASIRHYLRETHRVLRSGGRIAFTAYALTPHRKEAAARGEGSISFQHWKGDVMVMDPRHPERAIAHPAAALSQAISDAGLLMTRPFLKGSWLGEPEYDGGQDLFIATKP